MSTDYPYSKQWRDRTHERGEALGLTLLDLARQTGVDGVALAEGWVGRKPFSLEVAGPIDELLDRLEEQAEAAALEECTVHHPGVGSPRVRRIDVDLGPLADCDAEFTNTPHVPADAFDHLPQRRSQR